MCAKRKPSRSMSRGRTRGRTSSTFVPSSSRSRTRGSSVATSRSLGGRSLSRRRSAPVSINVTTRESGNADVRAPKVKNGKNKRVTIKKPKSVKITSKFRAQVKKALKPSGFHGTFTEIQCDLSQLSGTLGGKQKLINCCPDLNLSNTNTGHCVFSPIEVLNAASVLFYDRQNPFYKWAVDGDVAGGTDFGTQMLNPLQEKIEVVSSSFDCVFRNNTRRTIIMQLYEVAPKYRSNQLTDFDCTTQWQNCLLNDAQAYVDAATGQDFSGKNLNSVTPNTLYVTPFLGGKLVKAWNIEKHDITLDPGQVYEHHMVGPSGVYDFAKFWKNDASGLPNEFMNNQPAFTRGLFATYRYDLVQRNLTSNPGPTGRWGDDTANQGLLMEYKKHFKIKCPESIIGNIQPLIVADGQTTLAPLLRTRLRDVYFHTNWTSGEHVGVDRIEATTGMDNIPL